MSTFSIRDALGLQVPEITVVDIGAMPEGEERYAPLVRQGLARVVGFEPQQEQYEKLTREQQGSCRYLPYFLGTGGPATFYVTRYPGCSSNYEPDPAVIDCFSTIGTGPGGNFNVIETQEIETRKLDDIEECPAPDFIKLDVQGSELDVLQGGVASIANALVMEMEAEFVPMYRDQPLFGDLQVFLRRQGFVLHKFIDVRGRTFAPVRNGANPYAPLSQLLAADAIFIRDFAHPERYTDEDLIKAAVILHDLYRSYDLVAYFLLELDRRTGECRTPRYMEKIASHGQGEIMFLNMRGRP